MSLAEDTDTCPSCGSRKLIRFPTPDVVPLIATELEQSEQVRRARATENAGWRAFVIPLIGFPAMGVVWLGAEVLRESCRCPIPNAYLWTYFSLLL
jgi:hypothetical protein